MKPLWMVAAACAVLVGACSRSEPDAVAAATSTPAAAQKTQAAQKNKAPAYPRVEIATNAGLFWFVPRRCSVGPDADSGVMSFSIEGAGQAPDGQPVYVTINDEDSDPAMEPSLRINVGTDKPLKTPEVVLISDTHNTRVPVATTTVQGETLEVRGAVFTRQDERLTTQGPIRIDCTRR